MSASLTPQAITRAVLVSAIGLLLVILQVGVTSRWLAVATYALGIGIALMGIAAEAEAFVEVQRAKYTLHRADVVSAFGVLATMVGFFCCLQHTAYGLGVVTLAATVLGHFYVEREHGGKRWRHFRGLPEDDAIAGDQE